MKDSSVIHLQDISLPSYDTLISLCWRADNDMIAAGTFPESGHNKVITLRPGIAQVSRARRIVAVKHPRSQRSQLSEHKFQLPTVLHPVYAAPWTCA